MNTARNRRRHAAGRITPGVMLAAAGVLGVHTSWTATAAAGSVASSEQQHATPKYDARTFYETESVGGGSFNADGSKLLFSSDRTGVFNAYVIPADGGETRPVTTSDTNAVFGVSFFPADDRILYTFDEGGNELTKLFVKELDGESVALTPAPNSRASFMGWTKDDSTFFVMTNERDPRFMDIYAYDAESYEREMLFENAGGFQPAAVSGDGRWVATILQRHNADNDIYLVDTHNPDAGPQLITEHEGDVAHTVFGFGPDSDWLYFGSNENSEFTRAWRHRLATGEREKVVDDDWDVSFLGFSENGTYRVHAVNADASTEVTIIDTRTGERVDLPRLPQGDITGVSMDDSETMARFSISSDDAPNNLFVWNMQTDEVTRLTDTLNPSVEQEHLVESTVVRYKSFDGLDIPALLFKPNNASADNPVPAIVAVHGGPGGQFRKGYRADFQFLVNHGYAILAVNNRGSSGYGKTFFHMDDRKHGDVDLKDCIEGRTYLESLDWVDGEHVAIMGGSYGGYMVAAALAFEPEAFDAGINIFGVTNWVRTLQSIPPWWEDFKAYLYAEMGDPNDPEQLERLRAISPLFHAENIVKPMLVVQGANDPRVLQAESDDLVAAARENGATVEYVLFEDEGHGFRNRENRIEAAEAYLTFLNEHLRGMATD